MSRNTEYTMFNKPRGLGSRSSKSSFPPSYISSMNGISSSLSKVTLQESNLNNSGFNINLSAKKIKPRRSMLGRRSKMFSSNDTDSSNFLRPSHSSSSKNIGSFLTTTQNDKNKLSPSHPFSDLNSSSFFENGQSSDFSTWSIFKKGDIHKPPRSPGKYKFQSAPVQVPVKETTKKNFELDDSLGTIPLDCLSPNVGTEKLTFSAFKNKKLSVVKEETEKVPVIMSKSEVIQEEPSSLSKLINSWFIAKKEWDESKQQLEKDTQIMNELNNQINQILKSQITTSNTDCCKIEIASNKENENPTPIQDPASKNKLVDTIYGEFKSSYALLQTPSMLSSMKKKPINAQCYTPKSLSSCVKQQIKLIYGSDD